MGGHCIGVDPYYLTHKAQELGHHPEVILSGRRINDGMSKYIASTIVKEMLSKGLTVNKSNVNVLGLTFKENCPDLRNTKVIDIIRELEEYGITVNVHDAEADKEEAKKFYNIDLMEKNELPNTDLIVFAVPHNEYVQNKNLYLNNLSENGIIIDIKNIIEECDLKNTQTIWRL